MVTKLKILSRLLEPFFFVSVLFLFISLSLVYIRGFFLFRGYIVTAFFFFAFDDVSSIF